MIHPKPTAPSAILSTPNDTSDPDSHQLAPEKVHIRGLDNLTTKDIRAFASEHFDSYRPVHIEWIDDTSANIVYESSDVAQQALVAFAAVDIADVNQLPALHSINAKSFALHPDTYLQVRIAVLGDRKQAGARDRSRFYLLNPEHDPAERRKRNSHRGENRYRERDDGGYRSQRYDEREHRKRQDGDAEAGFDASLYDDDDSALAKRASRNIRREYSHRSTSRSRNRYRSDGGPVKELFPERGAESGRLRDRSASPMREDEDELRRTERRRDTAAIANREKASSIKARLRESDGVKELFPQKLNGKHRRSDAFDAADETADLFSNRMAVPFTDGGGDERPLASRVTNRHPSSREPVFNIRGAASSQPQGFSIKGAAGSVKELFPASLGDNSKKELFANLEGRGRRRQKAEDLFS